MQGTNNPDFHQHIQTSLEKKENALELYDNTRYWTNKMPKFRRNKIPESTF